MRKSKSIYISIILAIFFIVLLLSNSGALTARAAVYTGYYTDVLDDLKKDSTFTMADYPADTKDYSLEVMQIAEGENGELFIYVYQPSQAAEYMPATSINFATTIDGLSFKNYKLRFLNSSSVFAKYLVEGFTVKPDALRYYNISSIFRAWDKTVDEEPGNNNTVSEVSYAVGKLYTAETVGDEVTYYSTEKQVVTITDKYVGRLRYLDGFYLLAGVSCDSHYVAFSTDYPIDRLYEAEIEYVEQSIVETGLVWLWGETTEVKTTKGAPQTIHDTILYSQSGENHGGGWFGKKYTWDRISSASDFIAGEELTDNAKAALEGKQWVLRFTETEFIATVIPPQGAVPGSYTKGVVEVSDVTILRLKFETAGKVYNLGVVDNKQTGSGSIDNTNTGGTLPTWVTDGLPGWAIALIVVVLVVLVIVVICVIFPAVAPFIGKLLSALWWLITLPFRGLALLINKLFDIRDNNNA